MGWKELRQISPLVIGIAAIQLLVIVLLYALNAALQQDFPVEPAFFISIAMVSPTLLAIAMVGVAIGQERQSGSWTWSSSLPISWTQSLLGKVVVWFAGSVLMTALLLAAAAMVIALQGKSFGEAMFSEWQSWTHLMAIVIAIQVFLYFAIATLLLRDTLFAMVLAGIFVAVFHCVVVTVAISSVHSVQDRAYLSDEATVAVAYAASFLIGCLALAGAYRWRWGSGNYSALINYDVPQPRPLHAAKAYGLDLPIELDNPRKAGCCSPTAYTPPFTYESLWGWDLYWPLRTHPSCTLASLALSS